MEDCFMSDIHSVDVEDDQFAYRYDTQLLIDRRDEDLDRTLLQIILQSILKETA